MTNKPSATDLCLKAFKDKKRLTDAELSNYTQLPDNNIRPARLQMEKLGLIVRTRFVKDENGHIMECSPRNRRRGYHRIYQYNKSSKDIKTKPQPIIKELKKIATVITMMLKDIDILIKQNKG